MRTESDKLAGRITLVVVSAVSLIALVVTYDPLWMIAIMLGLIVLAIEDPG